MIGLILMALAAPSMAPEVAATVRYDSIAYRTVKNGPAGRCQLALVPRGDGKISAYATAADGHQRIIYFQKGEAKFSNAGGRIEVDRNGDTMIIRVGAAEVYEVPDRLVAGD